MWIIIAQVFPCELFLPHKLQARCYACNLLAKTYLNQDKIYLILKNKFAIEQNRK